MENLRSWTWIIIPVLWFGTKILPVYFVVVGGKVAVGDGKRTDLRAGRSIEHGAIEAWSQ